MQTLTNFRMLAYGIDVSPLRDALDAQPDLWREITGRQDYPGSPHKDTETIFLRAPARLERPEDLQEDLTSFNTDALERLPEARAILDPILDLIGATELGRVTLVKLHKGGSIDAHIDQGSYARRYSRFHVAITSAPGNVFQVENEVTRMPPGTFWWINHRRTHHVINQSDSDRIHLIFDAVVPFDQPENQDGL